MKCVSCDDTFYFRITYSNLVKSNIRKLTTRSGGREISIPKEYVEFLGMYVDGNEMKNNFGKEAKVVAWLNEANEIVLANQEIIPISGTIGLVVLDNFITKRSGTFGFIIPYGIMRQYGLMGYSVKAFTVRKFENNRLILTPNEKL